MSGGAGTADRQGPARRGLIRDIGWSAVLKIGYLALQTSVNIVLARLLGVESFGFYALVMAWVQLLLVPVLLGFPASLVRHMGQHAAAGTGFAARRLMRVAAAAVLGTAMLAAGLWAATGFLLDPGHGIAVAVLVVALSQTEIAGAALRGLGHVVASQLAQQILRPAMFLMLLGFAVLTGVTMAPGTAFAFHAGAAALAAGIAMALLQRPLARLPDHGDRQNAPQILFASLPFLLLASIQALNYQIDLVVVGMLMQPADVGLYRAAVQVVDGLGVVLFAFSMALGPRIVRLQAEKDPDALGRLLLRAHLTAGAIMLVAAGTVAALAAPIVTLLFGAAFAPAAAPLILLALGKILYACVGFSGLGLSMLGRPGRSTWALSFGLVLNVVLTVWLIPLYGLIGAAMATVIAAFAGNLLAAVLLARAIRALR
ncbi:oligosaccharide flippase family protein [Cognatishimia sp. F0-27]|uniref:oligosaccharide flippase family protein n=1 Tax=Cognatishimia sp. F0-27 TaxID=2816855 RepID=UPI001D0C69AA|nr:oligosaccharide flippase family protein [Cognatishimia sp. F0-27]MCC1494832.1 oligosaccharide flippase family protein [Cognatishimia sp. F0-27]